MLSKLREKFPEIIFEEDESKAILIPSSVILEVCIFLKSSAGLEFDYMMNLAVVDLKDRLEIVYHLFSFTMRHKVTIKVRLERQEPVLDSVSSIWRGADWFEREAYDMFGVRFNNHPDMRRILLSDEWVGYPLRKDYADPELEVLPER